MRKILLLGGSAQQVIAIKTAQRLGYYTVLCDYLTDNPGQYEANKFYLVSTTDMETVLDVAKKENVDGVLAYASDPAAPTAAYVAEKMGLPTNPYHSVKVLCNKDLFREFLRENGFSTPKSAGYETVNDAVSSISEYHFPVIIKPVDSSGSKGVTVLHSLEGLKKCRVCVFVFTRTQNHNRGIYRKKHPYLIGGDIFVYDGQVIQWGLMNCHRDNSVNPLVPVGKSYPPLLDECDLNRVKDTLQSMVDKLGIRAGAMNVELVIDKNNRVWPLDIGPRSGGNMIPDLLGMIFDTDVVEMSVMVAMGDRLKIVKKEGTPFYATHNLHSTGNGIFQGISYSDDIRSHIVRECIYKKTGDDVQYFDNAAKAIGIVFLKFEDEKTMMDILTNIHEHIVVKLGGLK